MNPRAIFEGSNGAATQALYRSLELLGPAGVIAMNLFRACKCSGRAKAYRSRYKGEAYERKNWSLQNLCTELAKSAAALGIEWGWGEDDTQEFHRWVLYVEIPTSQVSFHTENRMCPKDYPSHWDGSRDSPSRIIRWTTGLLNGEQYAPTRTEQPKPMPELPRHKLDKSRDTGGPRLKSDSRRGMEMLDLWEVALRTGGDGYPEEGKEHHNGVGVVS